MVVPSHVQLVAIINQVERQSKRDDLSAQLRTFHVSTVGDEVCALLSVPHFPGFLVAQIQPDFAICAPATRVKPAHVESLFIPGASMMVEPKPGGMRARAWFIF